MSFQFVPYEAAPGSQPVSGTTAYENNLTWSQYTPEEAAGNMSRIALILLPCNVRRYSVVAKRVRKEDNGRREVGTMKLSKVCRLMADFHVMSQLSDMRGWAVLPIYRPWQTMQKPTSKHGKTLVGAPEVPLDFFLTAILPPLSDSIPNLEADLAKDGLTADGLWTLNSSRPSTSGKVPDHFGDLVQIFDSVVEAAEKALQRPPNVRLVHSIPDAVTGTHPPLPDAQIRLIAPDSDSSSCFTAVPWKIESMRHCGK
ncbi:hypothetical protein DFH06DRAFT_1391487 [Mycena polygramma]|nr:hypothetical protein DFH06DRAFT_1391487 [Mycena polygramma]